MSLQSRTQTLDDRLSAVVCVKESFSKKRNTESFQALYTKATRMCETLHLTPIASPRVRIPPQHFTGVLLHMYMCPLLTTTGLNSTKFWRLRERFEQEGMQMLRHLEQVLLTGKIHGAVQQYQKSTQTSSKFSLHCSE